MVDKLRGTCGGNQRKRKELKKFLKNWNWKNEKKISAISKRTRDEEKETSPFKPKTSTYFFVPNSLIPQRKKKK